MSELIMPKTTLIIDGYGFIFRAYHSLPPLTNSENTPVGALYGFISMLLKILVEFKPTHAVVVFDYGGKTFRHVLYNEYKGHRPKVPDDLIPQFSLCRQAAEVLNFTIIEKSGFEADDIIATLTREVIEHNEKAIIISSDKDLMQLITDDILMFDPLKNKFITKIEVFEKFGVPPAQVIDVLAIMGDSSDNIPGIYGIGPKGAAELINKYGTLENMLDNVAEISQPKRKQAITDNYEIAILSKKLVTLDQNVNLNLRLFDLVYNSPNLEKLFNFLRLHGFKSLITKSEKLFNSNHHNKTIHQISLDTPTISTKIDFTDNFVHITDIDNLKIILNSCRSTGYLAIHVAEHNQETVGIAFAVDQNHCYYINIDNNIDLFNKNSTALNINLLLETFKTCLADQSILKIVYNYKSLLHSFDKLNKNIYFNSVADIMLMYYAMNTGNMSSDLHHIINEYFPTTEFSSVINLLQENKIKIISALDIAILTQYFCKTVFFIYSLYPLLLIDLKKRNSFTVYYELDMPLTTVLYKMEQSGIKIDSNQLFNLSNQFEKHIKALEANIYEITGQTFNIASPKQLGEILFDSMGLPSKKTSTKSGSYSTGVDVLESLSEAGFEIADLILKWRQLSKLKNTYTDVLPKLINLSTHRIHTNFLQTSTNTGRLSSQEPNLQNIPVRTELGELIRSAFIAEPGFQLISADYSQIELRLLSHIAQINSLKDAFMSEKDIHLETACQVFKIDKSLVTSDLRRKAKAINFGIIYGISSFGLAKQLNISRQEASTYIKAYFKEYPGIEYYMENIKQYARQFGYVQSLFLRRCYVKSINDKGFQMKNFSERAAINAPLQGSTADIAKLAMIKIYHVLKARNLKTRLLLQVHDELLFEAPDDEVDIVKSLIQDIMQNVIKLSVPLTVDINSGGNWSVIH